MTVENLYAVKILNEALNQCRKELAYAKSKKKQIHLSEKIKLIEDRILEIKSQS